VSSCQWNYKEHPLFPDAVVKSLKDMFTKAYGDTQFVTKMVAAPSLIHRALFRDVTQESNAQFAGGYRGSPDRCLSNMTVTFGGQVGASPDSVSYQMLVFGQQARSYLRRLAKAEVDSTRRSILRATIAARLFTDFIFVHPFADGNGHTARTMVAMIYLGDRVNLEGWPVEPRSDSVDYVDLAQRFRRGEMSHFVDLLLSSSGSRSTDASS
jgi:hypothetical protein